MKARIVVRYVILLTLFAGILMGAAGTVRYWQGWAFLAVMGGGGFAMVVYLARRDPALLQRRMQRQEQRPVQRLVHYGGMAVWLLAFLLAGLDRRRGWGPELPWWASALGLLAVAWGYWVTFATLRVNTFAGATIGLEKNQHVIASGPYRMVRHPMYAGIAVLILGMPIGLGSVVALAAAGIMILLLVIRLLDEEKMLRLDLPGYAEYCARVRWRLAPGVF